MESQWKTSQLKHGVKTIYMPLFFKHQQLTAECVTAMASVRGQSHLRCSILCRHNDTGSAILPTESFTQTTWQAPSQLEQTNAEHDSRARLMHRACSSAGIASESEVWYNSGRQAKMAATKGFRALKGLYAKKDATQMQVPDNSVSETSLSDGVGSTK